MHYSYNQSHTPTKAHNTIRTYVLLLCASVATYDSLLWTNSVYINITCTHTEGFMVMNIHTVALWWHHIICQVQVPSQHPTATFSLHPVATHLSATQWRLIVAIHLTTWLNFHINLYQHHQYGNLKHHKLSQSSTQHKSSDLILWRLYSVLQLHSQKTCTTMYNPVRRRSYITNPKLIKHILALATGNIHVKFSHVKE